MRWIYVRITVKVIWWLHLTEYVRTPAKNIQFIINLSGSMKIAPSSGWTGCDCFSPRACINVKHVCLIWVALHLRVKTSENNYFISPASHGMAITSTRLIAMAVYSPPGVCPTTKSPHNVIGSKAIVTTAPQVYAIVETDNCMTIPKILT